MTAVGPSYDGVRCLLLGADGFIGRSVARALVRAGAVVHASVLDTRVAAPILAPCGGDVQLREDDLLPRGAAKRLLEETAPDVVFNLAGYGVRRGEMDEAVAERLNTGLVAELADTIADRASNAAHSTLVHVGSAAEYGDARGSLREDGPALPSTLYGRTKLAGAKALLASGAPAVIARPFTVYGPGEPPHRLLPALLRAATTGDPVALSAGTQLRDFTYVEDVAEGLLRLGRAPLACAQAVNLCTGTLLAVREFVATAAGILGIAEEALHFGELGGGVHDMAHDPVDVSRLEALTGWRPRIDVAEGVRLTHDFVRGRACDDDDHDDE